MIVQEALTDIEAAYRDLVEDIKNGNYYSATMAASRICEMVEELESEADEEDDIN